MEKLPTLKYLNECSLLVTFSDKISLRITTIITKFCEILRQTEQTTFTEIVPSYCSVLLIYDPLTHLPDSLLWKIKNAIHLAVNMNTASLHEKEQSTIVVPVKYDTAGKYDLLKVADEKGLSVTEVIKIHTEQTYHVFSFGFIPGFCYMGLVDKSIQVSRKENPREIVPKGAVAIAQSQTGIYPYASPGGWNIIGIANKEVFNTHEGSIFEIGSRVKFITV